MVSTGPPTLRAATPPTPVQTDAVVADALVVDVSELSTWEQAVVAATTNDAARLRALLAAEPGLRTLRVTAEDVSRLSSTSGVHVTQGRLLIECALERDHEDVVMPCLRNPNPNPNPSPRPNPSPNPNPNPNPNKGGARARATRAAHRWGGARRLWRGICATARAARPLLLGLG